MKKTLEAELMSIAHRILQLKNKADVHELKAVTGVLYEKLSVLSFTEKYFDGPQPTIGRKNIEKTLTEEIVAPSKSKKEDNTSIKDDARPDGTEHNTQAITEPNTEKIKDIVASMPPETQKVDEVLENILPQKEEDKKDEFRNLGGVHYDDLPQFERPSEKKVEKKENKIAHEITSTEEPQFEEKEVKNDIEKAKDEDLLTEEQQNLFGIMPEFERKEDFNSKHSDKKKSLNDRLKKGIQIGLNDRLSYIKHLFDGDASDYNRVLSQLNTIESYPEAERFINEVVKPDYNHWENKEVYENRFLQAIENKYA
ncbi:hypothetical protein [Mesonia sp. K4-1]|uniref:hypothetical protein n=1 Tax=Mesonia sp. K4-1 TaxID=2602760 RepID=UPI0011CB6BBC|nr:hypothetical protein [Mesonia sp. K4-1]TXK78587.1 hypothetical protein FT986_01995 [Mesonia sp. K4-1]